MSLVNCRRWKLARSQAQETKIAGVLKQFWRQSPCTGILTHGSWGPLAAPFPIADLRQVLPIPDNVLPMLDKFVSQQLLEMRGDVA